MISAWLGSNYATLLVIAQETSGAMPLIFAESEATESGITYQDRTGVSYQYPGMYKRVIEPGERFIYYRGRKRFGGGRAPQVYFGTGIIGTVRQDPDSPERFRCDILDYREFQEPVFFKDPAGRHYELGGSRRGYFQQGVRRVSEREFRRILAAADSAGELYEANPERSVNFHSFASRETIAQVEAFSMDVAVKELRRRFPSALIETQPRNNPGFDILIQEEETQSFVEVKGTKRPIPAFFITQGEVEFSHRRAEQFFLLVVYRIDLPSGAYKLHWHEGAVSGERFQLEPVHWACRVRDEG